MDSSFYSYLYEAVKYHSPPLFQSISKFCIIYFKWLHVTKNTHMYFFRFPEMLPTGPLNLPAVSVSSFALTKLLKWLWNGCQNKPLEKKVMWSPEVAAQYFIAAKHKPESTSKKQNKQPT